MTWPTTDIFFDRKMFIKVHFFGVTDSRGEYDHYTKTGYEKFIFQDGPLNVTKQKLWNCPPGKKKVSKKSKKEMCEVVN